MIFSKAACPSGYYIYFYLNEQGLPYYCGKGIGFRAIAKTHSVPIPPNLSNIIIAEENLTELGALALERRYIRWYGRANNGTGILLNKSDGGDGSTGALWTKEARQAKSIQMKGKPQPAHIASALRTVRKGKKNSNEHKEKCSNALKGREFSDEWKAKLKAAWILRREKLKIAESDRVRLASPKD